MRLNVALQNHVIQITYRIVHRTIVHGYIFTFYRHVNSNDNCRRHLRTLPDAVCASRCNNVNDDFAVCSFAGDTRFGICLRR